MTCCLQDAAQENLALNDISEKQVKFVQRPLETACADTRMMRQFSRTLLAYWYIVILI
jgi:hypothetical protein